MPEMNERVPMVAPAEGAGRQIASEGKMLATVHANDRATERAILAAKRFAGEGGVGIVRVVSRTGSSIASTPTEGSQLHEALIGMGKA